MRIPNVNLGETEHLYCPVEADGEGDDVFERNFFVKNFLSDVEIAGRDFIVDRQAAADPALMLGNGKRKPLSQSEMKPHAARKSVVAVRITVRLRHPEIVVQY